MGSRHSKGKRRFGKVRSLAPQLGPTALPAAAVMLAILGGFSVNRPLIPAIILAVVIGFACLLMSRPHIEFIAIAFLAISPSLLIPASAGLGADGVQKMILCGAVLLLLLKYGAVFNGAVVIIMLTLTWSLAYSLTDPLVSSDVDSFSVLRAFLGYAFPWLALLIKWDEQAANSCLTLLRALPIISIAAGVVLQLVGVTSVVRFEYTGAIRLEGALIGAHLAMVAFMAIAVSLYELSRGSRLEGQFRWIMVNLAVLLLTVTRGSIIACCVLIGVMCLGLYVHRRRAHAKLASASRKLSALLVLGIFAIFPVVMLRSAGDEYEGEFNTSGRQYAWDFYLEIAGLNHWGGRGLGFANVANSIYMPEGVQGAFEAPHNEYIHFYVDVGIIATVVLFAGFLIVFAKVARKLNALGRWFVLGLVLATATYAFFDNVFSTPQFIVPACLLLGAANRLSSLEGPSRKADQLHALPGQALIYPVRSSV
jgi:O-antigen ligase